jgi:AcrR family transcriptional regulator
VPTEADRYELIVRAATTCFRRWGYGRTRMEDIAKEAGIARTVIYRHVDSKERLLLEVIVRHIRRRGEQLHASLPRRGPAGPLLLEAFMWGVTSTDDRAVVETLLGIEVMHDTARLIADSEQVSSAMADYWRPYLEYARDTGALRDGVDIEKAVRWLTIIRFSFLSLPEVVPADDELAGYLDTFVVGALVG